MRNQRSLNIEFKGEVVVEELLRRESLPAQLCRRYNIQSGERPIAKGDCIVGQSEPNKLADLDKEINARG